MKVFAAPKEAFSALNAESAATLISAASDVALILDAKGIIRDLAFRTEELSTELEAAAPWPGRAWIDTVTVESQPKVKALLRDARPDGNPLWRQVNHPSSKGADVPVLYSAVRVGSLVVAVGRDLGAVASLQQRLVAAQQSMERDYSRLRHVETRYRLLFQMSSEAVLILDATSQKVLEANPTAQALIGGGKRGTPRPFTDLFDPAGREAVGGLLARVRALGRAEHVEASLADGGQGLTVFAYLFRQENASLLLIRLARAAAAEDARIAAAARSKLLSVIERATDAFVVTDLDGRIVSANAAFLDMAQVAGDAQARGEMLDRWLGRPGLELDVLRANLRQHGSVRLYATKLTGDYGADMDVEVSAVQVTDVDPPCLGFTIRNVGRRLAPASSQPGAPALPRSVEQLTELIGRVSLKDLVREATDVIERLCIEAALELTGDNRASAAEMLGLSRQSLYVKLRRYGLGDLAQDEGNG